MKARKIVLLSLIAVLLCVYIIQLASAGKGSVQRVSMTDEPDRLVIESAVNGKIIVSKKDDVWYLGDRQQYETQESEVNILLDALKEYSILQTVSKGGDEVLYGLDDSSKITLTAYKGDEILCQIDIGKDASTSRQSYIRRTGEKEIYLISDSFNSVFDVCMDDLRNRNVHTLNTDDIQEAMLVSNNAGVVMMSRDENGDWMGNYTQMTADGIASWISTIAYLNTGSWLPDDWQPSVEPLGIVMLKMNDRMVTDTIYPVEGEEDTYIGTSTECPYAFYMSSFTADKFLRTADDFAQ